MSSHYILSLIRLYTFLFVNKNFYLVRKFRCAQFSVRNFRCAQVSVRKFRRAQVSVRKFLREQVSDSPRQVGASSFPIAERFFPVNGNTFYIACFHRS